MKSSHSIGRCPSTEWHLIPPSPNLTHTMPTSSPRRECDSAICLIPTITHLQCADSSASSGTSRTSNLLITSTSSTPPFTTRNERELRLGLKRPCRSEEHTSELQ